MRSCWLITGAVLLAGCYSSKHPARDCATCRGSEAPSIDVSTWISYEYAGFLDPWAPWAPLPADRAVPMWIVAGLPPYGLIPLRVQTHGLCWQESRIEWWVVGCEDPGCSDSLNPDAFLVAGLFDHDPDHPERGPMQAIWIAPNLNCPLSPEVVTNGIDVDITVTELGRDRGLGGEVCTEDLRTVTARFHVGPICHPDDWVCERDCLGGGT